METLEIMRGIRSLSIAQRLWVAEQTLNTIRESETRDEMAAAADLLLEDYQNDKELTVFTALDFGDFLK